MNLRIRIMCLMLGGMMSLNTHAFAGSYKSGIDLEDDISLYANVSTDLQRYSKWFVCYNNTYWGDLIYNDINTKTPPFLLDIIKNKGWKIVLVDKNYIYNILGANYRGCTIFDEKKVLVEGFYRGEDLVKKYQDWGCDQEYLDNTDLVTLGYLAVRSNIFHELGHVLDYRYKYSYCDDWNRIYNAEKGFANEMSSRYWEGMTKGTINLKSSWEFWSTCFEAYILCREDLEKYCPKAYAYMHNIIYNLEKEYEVEHPETDYYQEKVVVKIKK